MSLYFTNSSGNPYTHGQALQKGKCVGVVVKQAPSAYDATLAQQSQVADGEDFLLIDHGVVDVDGGFAVGDPLYFRTDGALSNQVISDEIQKVVVAATGGTFKLNVNAGTVATVTIVEAVKGDGGNDEQQTITLAAATGGTFALTWDDTGSNPQTTTALAYNATGATVQTAMRALSNLADADITVTGSAGGPYTATFLTAFAKTDVRMIVADTTLLTPKEQTGTIAFDATATVVKAALEATSYIAPGDVVVTKTAAKTWEIAFGGALADLNIPAMTGEAGGLTGPGSTVTITTEDAGAVGAKAPFGRVLEDLPGNRVRVDLDMKSSVDAASF